MRLKRLAAGAVLLAGLAGGGYYLWHWGPGLFADPAAVRRRIESDLHLRVELKSERTVEAGDHVWGFVTLVNRSPTETHRVIKPGSESGPDLDAIREPRAYWTSDIDRGGGDWVPVTDKKRFLTRCGQAGLRAPHWPEDMVRLGPGGELEFHLGHPFEFQQAGRVRLRAHYDYRGGTGRREPLTIRDRARVAGLPPFELVSDPVEFEVVRPIDVGVRVVRPPKAGRAERLSEVLAVTVANRSGADIVCVPWGDRLEFRVQGGWPNRWPVVTAEPTGPGRTRVLKPGEAVQLLGRAGSDGTWECPEPGRAKVRAVYTPAPPYKGWGIMSEWVEVQVEE